MVNTPCFHYRGTSVIPGQAIKILHAMHCGQKIGKKNRKQINTKENNNEKKRNGKS